MNQARERVVLEIVEDDASRGFAVPARDDGAPAFRGMGDLDYVCGRCTRLLAIGVRPGVFSSLVLRCQCGALNRPLPRPPLA